MAVFLCLFFCTILVFRNLLKIRIVRTLILFLLITSFTVTAQKPEVVVSNGHTDAITTMDFSDNGKWLATGSLDKLVKIIHNSTGKELRTFSGNSGRVSFVKFDDKAKVVGAHLNSDEIKFWSMETGELLARYETPSNYSEFDFVLNNSKALIIGKEGQPHLYDFHQQSKPTPISELKGVTRFKALENSDEAIVYDYKGKLSKFNLKTGAVTAVRQLHPEYSFCPTRIDSDHDGKYLAMVFNTTEIHIINTSDLSTHVVLKGHDNMVKDIKFDEKSSTLLSIQHGSKDLFVWDLEAKKLESRNNVIDFSGEWIEPHPKQDLILIADWKKLLYVDRKTMKVSKIFRSRANKILNMAYDQKGKYLAAASLSMDIKLWDLEQNKIVKKFQGFWPVAIDPTGRKLLSNYMSIKIAVWDIESEKKLAELPTQGDLIQKICFSQDGKMVAGMGLQGKVFIWDMETYEIKQVIKWPAGMTYGIVFSPDGKYIAASGLQNSFYVWDVESGKQVAYKDGFMLMMSDLKFSPDGNYFAASNWDKKVYIYDTKTWELKSTLEGHVNVVQTIDISADGKYLASGAGNNTVQEADNSVIVWDVATGQQVCRYTGHVGAVNKVIFDKTSQLVYSCGDDGAIKAWNYQDCQEVGTFVSVNETDYIITTPDYYYMASKDALDAVSFRVADNLYPFDQFDLKLNRPDIVSKRLGKTPQGVINAYEYLYKKRLRKMNFDESDLAADFKLPVLEMKGENIPLVTNKSSIQVPIHAYDETHKLNRINVYLNDVPLYGMQGIKVDKGAMEVLEDITVNLIEGTNKIQLSVLNEKGVESLRHTLSIVRSESGAKSDLYVVTIGVSEYADDRFNLKYPVKDARDVTTTLSSAQDLYKNVHHKALLNKEVTLENVAALESFLGQAKPDDVIIIFVAGHGVLDEHFEYYYGTHDIDFDHPEKRGLPYDALDDLLVKTKAIKKLLIMDTCHSGEVDKEEVAFGETVAEDTGDIQFRNAGASVTKKNAFGLENSVQMLENMFSDVRKGSGAHVISSAGGAEYAMESDEWQNGLFTYCLLYGIQKGKANLDRKNGIVISELKKYVYDQVNELSQGKQKPTSREENSSMDYRVW